MNALSLLATIGEQTAVPARDVEVVPVDFIWQQITDLSWLHAVIAISVGIVYMLYGWRIFRVLVVICFGLAGMFLGILAGTSFTFITEMWGGILGLVVFAVISVPLMKWCVSILGAAAGGILTGGIWYACGLPQMYIWAGVIIGVVAGGLISFILLKASVMLFTSLGGSVLLTTGLLGLLHQYETYIKDPPTTYVHDFIFLDHYQWFLPVAIIVPTVIGMIVQNKFIKHSQKWEVK
ncbi:MAG: hypothetical protein H8E62_07565 [Planctomycetes bacterium]|nr:hypothetical protein [Planctomycetota bacterium]